MNNLPSVWQAALMNQNFVEQIQGYVTDNAKVSLPVQLCAMLYYLLPPQLVSYQNLKHPDPSFKR